MFYFIDHFLLVMHFSLVFDIHFGGAPTCEHTRMDIRRDIRVEMSAQSESSKDDADILRSPLKSLLNKENWQHFESSLIFGFNSLKGISLLF